MTNDYSWNRVTKIRLMYKMLQNICNKNLKKIYRGKRAI